MAVRPASAGRSRQSCRQSRRPIQLVTLAMARTTHPGTTASPPRNTHRRQPESRSGARQIAQNIACASGASFGRLLFFHRRLLSSWRDLCAFWGSFDPFFSARGLDWLRISFEQPICEVRPESRHYSNTQSDCESNAHTSAGKSGRAESARRCSSQRRTS